MFIPGLDRALELLGEEDAEDALGVLAQIIRLSRDHEEKIAFFPQLYRETVSEDGLSRPEFNRYLSYLEDAGLIDRNLAHLTVGYTVKDTDKLYDGRMIYVTTLRPTEMAEVALAIYQ